MKPSMRRPQEPQTQVWLHFTHRHTALVFPDLQRKTGVRTIKGIPPGFPRGNFHSWSPHPCLPPLPHQTVRFSTLLFKKFPNSGFPDDEFPNSEFPNSPLHFIIGKPQAQILLPEPGAWNPSLDQIISKPKPHYGITCTSYIIITSLLPPWKVTIGIFFKIKVKI